MVLENEAIRLMAGNSMGMVSAYREKVLESAEFDGTETKKVITYEPTHKNEIFFGEVTFLGDRDTNPAQPKRRLQIFVDDVLKYEMLGDKFAVQEIPAGKFYLDKPILIESGSKVKFVFYYPSAPSAGHKIKMLLKWYVFDAESNLTIEKVSQ